jgi:hypothetical protein
MLLAHSYVFEHFFLRSWNLSRANLMLQSLRYFHALLNHVHELIAVISCRTMVSQIVI